MTNTPVLTAIALSARNEVHILVAGREAMITTGARVRNNVTIYVEFNDDRTSGNFTVAADSVLSVVRVLS